MTKELKKSEKAELIEKVKSIKLEDLSNGELIRVAQAVVGDRLKDELKFKIKESDFDIKKLLKEFYSLKKSENTVKAYRKSIDAFLNWIKEQTIHPLNVTARTVDQYLIELNKTEMSGRSKHLLLSGIRNFYTYLVRYGYITINPFKSIPAMPKKERKRPLNVPSDKEIEQLRRYIRATAKSKGRGSGNAKPAAKAMLIILDLFIETGLRVGAIKTISFHHNLTIQFHSKGKDGKAVLSAKLYDNLRKLDLPAFNEARIQRNLEGYCERSGLTIFNPHAFRHYWSVEHYTNPKYKEYHDIYAIKEALGHSSISVTENYLRSLSVL